MSPAYDYECGACGEIVEEHFPIGTARRLRMCECGGVQHLMIGRRVQLSEKGWVTKGEDVRNPQAVEDRWDKDIPAYRRMRHNGLQPKGVDGAHRLEDQVGSQFDIDYKPLTDQGIPRERIREINEEWHQDWPTSV